MNDFVPARVYEFGGFRLDTSQRQLFAPDGGTVTLSSRVFDTLLHFVEHRGELLGKSALMKAVWPDTVVEENNLNQAISALRKALGEKKGQHRFIVTDPGRGYRFVGEVSLTDANQVDPVTSTSAAGEVSVAVLPFVDMSPDKDQEYFSDGIAEEILNHLSKVPDLRVAGRMSSFYFKGRNESYRVVGKELQVAHVLEGSVRKAGNRVRITAQLINVADGYHLWSKSYDRDLDDIFVVQDEIASAVTDALQITLRVGILGRLKGMTGNIAAYEDYLTGRFHSRFLERDYYLRAIEHLERAVSTDPDFGLAWGELAHVCSRAARIVIPDREAAYVEMAEQAADRALSLVPEAVDSLDAVAYLQMDQQREWRAAEATCKKALALAPGAYRPNYNYGLFLLNVGRPREAIDYFQRAGRAERLAMLPAYSTAISYELMGDYAAALKSVEHAKQRKVGSHHLCDTLRLVIGMATKDRELMEAAFEKTIAADNVLLPPANRSINPTMRESLDQPQAAREALHRFAEDPAFHNTFVRAILALWASYFGDDELALNVFYYEGAAPNVASVWSLWRRNHESLRRLSGFKDLLRDLGLVDYWRESCNWGDFCRPLGDDDFECL